MSLPVDRLSAPSPSRASGRTQTVSSAPDARRRYPPGVSARYQIEGAGRGTRVQRLFNSIAGRYDLINDLQSFGLHRWWKRRLVSRVDPTPGLHALDLCCGTGDISLALAQAGATVVGCDFSSGMLEHARRRAESIPSPVRPRFVQGDALELPFAKGAFDVVTVAYGMRNLADLPKGIREIRRVLKAGGRVLILDFGKPRNPLLRTVYFAYLKSAVPLLGWAIAGDREAYAYILDSLRHYPGQDGLDPLLRDAGFDETRVLHLFGGIMGINQARRPPD